MLWSITTSSLLGCAVLFAVAIGNVAAVLNATESSTELVISNSRLYAAVNKGSGIIYKLFLDGQDLLGDGIGGPYLDCYCVPAGAYTPGKNAPRYKLIQGVDSTKTRYGGIVMSETYPLTGQILEQYWFLRDGETGLHTFSRLAYYNKTKPFLRNLQEFRTLFRPRTRLWTNLTTNADLYAPLPSADAVREQIVVQDATWYLGNTTEDAYVLEHSDYFSKYMFQTTWRDHDVHGMFSDGSTSNDGSTFGAWMVMNTKDTYFGGPTFSDLVVDGIVYNYITSNHHGNGVPNITDGFDRTFGPQYYHFNRGARGSTLFDLRKDAAQYYSPLWNVDFYDSIAEYVPNYVPTSGRTTWKGQISLPSKIVRPIAILAQNKVDYQDNAQDTKAYQYWADINPSTGYVEIPRVKAGTYRLTVYGEGVFGQYTKDDVKVVAGEVRSTHARWREETAGTEIWRIGTPDKSSGEFRHGFERDTTHPNRLEQYREYWAVHDFPTEFPNGVVYTVGKSDPAKDLNYVHWSVFGSKANFLRPTPYYKNVNNWTLLFDLGSDQVKAKRQATFTVQLAGVKTAAGNTDIFNASEPYANLPYTVVVNGKALEPWVIPYYHSSSCAVRSAVTCYNTGHKFVFDSKLLVAGKNEFVLSLPPNATNYEPALLPPPLYVQYDALRLEIK